MRQSQIFYKTKREVPKEAEIISHKLLLRADFIDQLASGIYSFLPLGWKVHQKIENIIREEMLKIGAQEVFLPTLQPKTLWEETGRWKTIAPPLFKLKDCHRKEFGLGPTHEEAITDLARGRIKSYKDLPLYLFQIQNKFRNEMRSSGGLLRTREFIMKDLYSFHSSERDLKKYYQKVKAAYLKIFKRCKLKVLLVEASPGTIGGKLSHEYMVLSPNGEDAALFCKKCGFAANVEKVGLRTSCPKCKGLLKKERCIEVGHLFYLGQKYSKIMGSFFVDGKGEKKAIFMGCYGIGLGRLLATVVEVHHDKFGIIWPKEIAPFQVHLIAIEETSPKVRKVAEGIYQGLQKEGLEVLYDDREEKTAGQKFVEADLIGIPFRIVISEKTLQKNCVEIKKRSEKKIKLVKIKDLSRFFKIKKQKGNRSLRSL